jgi:hypothetical protein
MKTKIYIAPSKKDWIRPNITTLRSRERREEKREDRREGKRREGNEETDEDASSRRQTDRRQTFTDSGESVLHGLSQIDARVTGVFTPSEENNQRTDTQADQGDVERSD